METAPLCDLLTLHREPVVPLRLKIPLGSNLDFFLAGVRRCTTSLFIISDPDLPEFTNAKC